MPWPHQAMALTAAACSVKRSEGASDCAASQISSALSLPPDASWRPSGDHCSAFVVVLGVLCAVAHCLD